MRILLSILGTLAALLILAAAAIWTGAYNVAATDAHLPLVRYALDAAMANSVRARADAEPPALDASAAERGFAVYDGMCVQCHGAPGVEPAGWAARMKPEPPDLAEHAAHWSAAELFWIIRHGIKMSGMPAFGPTHEAAELWDLVAFVERMPEMDAEAYVARRQDQTTKGHHGGGAAHGE